MSCLCNRGFFFYLFHHHVLVVTISCLLTLMISRANLVCDAHTRSLTKVKVGINAQKILILVLILISPNWFPLYVTPCKLLFSFLCLSDCVHHRSHPHNNNNRLILSLIAQLTSLDVSNNFQNSNLSFLL